MIVISAHLDDGILSAGQLLAAYPKSTVITLFAGLPPDDVLTEFDRTCGFVNSSQAVDARREEDKRACAVLDATPIHLDFLDQQYVPAVAENRAAVDEIDDEVGFALRDTLRDLDDGPVFIPWGVQHRDHYAASALSQWACRELQRGHMVYEDLPGRVLYPELVRPNIDGYELATDQVAGPLHLKQAAIACYRSQHVLPELAPPWHTCLVPERFWRPV